MDLPGSAVFFKFFVLNTTMLKNFLQHILHIDYRMPCNIKLAEKLISEMTGKCNAALFIQFLRVKNISRKCLHTYLFV